MKKLLKKPIVYIASALLVVAIGAGIAYAAITAQKPQEQMATPPVTGAQTSEQTTTDIITSGVITTQIPDEIPPVPATSAAGEMSGAQPSVSSPPVQTSDPNAEKTYKNYDSFYGLRRVSDEQVLKIMSEMAEYEVFETLGNTFFADYAKGTDIKAYYITFDNKLIEIQCNDIKAQFGKSGAELLQSAIPLKNVGDVELKEETFDFEWSENETEKVTVQQQLWTRVGHMYFAYPPEPQRNADYTLFWSSCRSNNIVFEDGTPASDADIKSGTQVLASSNIRQESFPETAICEKIVVLR